MEQRKLIKLGNSSFAIALPKDWIKKTGLQKGDAVFLQVDSAGNMSVNAEYKKTNNGKTKILNFSNLQDPKAMEREISMAYLQDYSKIEIGGIKEKREFVKNIAKNLTGLEIVESTDEKIILKDFFDLNEVDLKDFVRRADNIIRSMFEDLEEGFEKEGFEQKDCNEIYNADRDLNKIYLLMNRLFVKSGSNPAVLSALNTTVIKMFNNWWLAYNLEHIGDELKRIAKIIANEKMKKEELAPVSKVLAAIKENYVTVLSSYYKNDDIMSFKAISERDRLMKLADSLAFDSDSAIAKTGEKLKAILSFIHQINKILVYESEK